MEGNFFFVADSAKADEKAICYMAYILKYGLFILPVISLIVSNSLFYPYITGKNYLFRIAVEIFLFLWIWVSIFEKKYRPKNSPLLVALTAFFIILSLATFFGENPYLSFWSNLERMEGLIGHLHLFAYFLIITSVFREERYWRRYFYTLVGVSTIVAIYGIGQIISNDAHYRVAATFGNASYLAIFMIFHIFLLFLLLRKTSNPHLRLFFVVLIGLETMLIFATKTRGAIVGFSFGAALLTLLTFILSKNYKARYLATVIIIVMLTLAGVFLLIENTSFVKKNIILDRIAQIHLKTEQVQVRLAVWKIALSGFKDHPFLGYGPENFHIAFNRYYDPSLMESETRFDRAHNVFIEWLITAGIAGLLAYLSVLVAVFYCLWKSVRKNSLEIMEASIMSSLFVVYLLFNLVLFDNLVSYFLFFTLLGYIHHNYSGVNAPPGQDNMTSVPYRQMKKGFFLLLPLSLIGVIFLLYFVNIKPLLAEKQLSRISKDFIEKRKNVGMILKDFDRILSYGTYVVPEAREELKLFANYVTVSKIDQKDKIRALNKAIDEMEKQVKNSPKDMRYFISLGSLYKNRGRLEDALTYLNKALELSPKRLSIRFEMAEVYLALERKEKALAVLQEAYELNPENSKTGTNLAVVAILNDRKEYAEALMDKHFSSKTKPDLGLLSTYQKPGTYSKMKEIWQLFVKHDPHNIQYRVNLAAAYVKLGDNESAVRELKIAIAFEPRFKQRGRFYIEELRAGRDPF